MKVMKFGGTALADASRIRKAVDIVDASRDGQLAFVVVSAMANVKEETVLIARTASQKDNSYREKLDSLKRNQIETAAEFADNSSQNVKFIEEQCAQLDSVCDGIFALGELSDKVLDRIMSFGLLCTSQIVADALRIKGVSARAVDSRDFIVTDETFGSARVDFEKTFSALKKLKVEKGEVAVFSGLVARSSNGRATTLGRYGVDYTASLVAAAFGADIVESWTDVDGVMTADPKQVDKAFSLKRMSYEEAMELSHFGADVIHSPAMQPLVEAQIPLVIRNAFNPEFKGTKICKGQADRDGFVTGISSISNVSFMSLFGSGMVGLTGVAGRLFTALAEEEINLIMISQGSSEHSICFAITPEDENRALSAMEREFEEEIDYRMVERPLCEKDKCVIAVVGANMRRKPGIAGKLFSALGEAGISVLAIAQGSSELNISIVIDAEQQREALSVVHSAFFSL